MPIDRIVARVHRDLPEILRLVEREIAEAAETDRLMALAADRRLTDNTGVLGQAYDALHQEED